MRKKARCIVAITGAIDLVSDGASCYIIRNGRPEMGKITGTGCQLSGMMTAFLAANPEQKLEAAAAAVCTMGLAGEIGWGYMQKGDGNATYRNRIIDAIYNMDKEHWRKEQNMKSDRNIENDQIKKPEGHTCKKMQKEDLLLYAVTDRHWLNGETLYSQVEKTLEGGTTFVQLREKELDEAHFLEEAKKSQGTLRQISCAICDQ